MTGSVILVSDHPSPASAFAAAAAVGGTLIVDKDFSLTESITVSLAADLRVEARGPRTITVPERAVPFASALQLFPAGHSLELMGDVLIDGNGRIAQGINVYSLQSANVLRIHNWRARNLKMHRGMTVGSSGFYIGGSFSLVELRNIEVDGVTREAGAGKPYETGCQAIVVTYAGGGQHNPTVIECENIRCLNITTEDLAGSPAFIDRDGLVIFQAREEGARCTVSGLLGIDCAGRTLKHFGHARPMVSNVEVHRSVQGNTGGTADLDFQSGDGILRNVSITYAGAAHEYGTYPVSMAAAAQRAGGFEGGLIDGLTIQDSTGDTVNALVLLDYSLTDTQPRLYVVQNIKTEGVRSRAVVSLGILGLHAPLSLSLENIDTVATETIVRCNSSPLLIVGTIKHVMNRNASEVPLIKRVDALDLTQAGGSWFDLGGNENIARFKGQFPRNLYNGQ